MKVLSVENLNRLILTVAKSKGGKKSEMLGQKVSFDPTNDARMWFFLTKRRITESIGRPTHTSGVNIPHKQTRTDLEVRGGIWTHSGAIRSPLPPTQTHFPSPWLTLSADRSPFLHYLSDDHWRSCCASRIILSMPCCLFISPMFPSVAFFGLLLQKQYTKSHDDTAASHPRTLPLTYSGTLPENS